MKILVKIISPETSDLFTKEFTIEKDSTETSISSFLHTLKQENPNLYSELTEDDLLSPQYLVIVNNELIFHNQINSYLLKDGDQISISFAIGGG